MRKTFLLPAVSLLSMALLVPAAFAKQGGGHGYHGKGMHKQAHQEMKLEKKFYHKIHMIMINQDALDLSDKQTQAIKELKQSTKKAMIRQEAEIKIIAVDINANLYENKIDVNATNALIDKKYALKTERAKVLVKAMADLKNQLNDKQLEKLKQLSQQSTCTKCKKKK